MYSDRFVLNEDIFEAAVRTCSKLYNYVVSVCIDNESCLDQWFTKIVHNLSRYTEDFGVKKFTISDDNSCALLAFHNNSLIEIGRSSCLLFKSYKYNDLICDYSILRRENLMERLDRRYEPYVLHNKSLWERISIEYEQNARKDWVESVDTSGIDNFLKSFNITQEIPRGTDT